MTAADILATPSKTNVCPKICTYINTNEWRSCSKIYTYWHICLRKFDWQLQLHQIILNIPFKDWRWNCFSCGIDCHFCNVEEKYNLSFELFNSLQIYVGRDVSWINNKWKIMKYSETLVTELSILKFEKYQSCEIKLI